MDWSSKVALVTGAGGAIGRATCLEFGAVGARVAVVDVDRKLGGETVEEILKRGGRAQFFQADVQSAKQVEDYVEQTLETFGRIDAFFNNAGIEGIIKPLTEYPEDVFDRVIAINLKGVFLGLKYVLPVMFRQKAGSVVNTGSVGSLLGSPENAGYVASKHAVLGLTRVGAVEGARYGVRVNAVCPGPINTRLMRSFESQINPKDPQAVINQVAGRLPVKRYGEPEEIARVVVFLASDDCSFVTGAVWSVDGGRTMA